MSITSSHQPAGVAIPGQAENGSPPPPPVGVPVAPQRPRNTLWIAAGIVLVLVSGLAALSITQSLSQRVEVLVAVQPISKGQTITEGDLGVASISVTSGVRAISPADRDSLIGMVATGPIGEGSVVHRAQFIDAEAEDQRSVVVGFELDPGGYPRSGLRPGDEVLIVQVSEGSASGDGVSTAQEITTGEIVDVAPLSQADAMLVSVRVSESISILVADRAAQGRISLVLVDDGFTDEVIEPLEPAQPVVPIEPGQPDVEDGAEGGPGTDESTPAPDGTAPAPDGPDDEVEPPAEGVGPPAGGGADGEEAPDPGAEP